mgnify:CR=1 FL=1
MPVDKQGNFIKSPLVDAAKKVRIRKPSVARPSKFFRTSKVIVFNPKTDLDEVFKVTVGCGGCNNGSYKEIEGATVRKLVDYMVDERESGVKLTEFFRNSEWSVVGGGALPKTFNMQSVNGGVTKLMRTNNTLPVNPFSRTAAADIEANRENFDKWLVDIGYNKISDEDVKNVSSDMAADVVIDKGLGQMNIKQVKELVENVADDLGLYASKVLEWEKANNNRKSLISWLEKRV